MWSLGVWFMSKPNKDSIFKRFKLLLNDFKNSKKKFFFISKQIFNLIKKFNKFVFDTIITPVQIGLVFGLIIGLVKNKLKKKN
jgi:hypothetical protein